jgi:hypothetical protein
MATKPCFYFECRTAHESFYFHIRVTCMYLQDGRTALHVAAKQGLVELDEILISRGACVTAVARVYTYMLALIQI